MELSAKQNDRLARYDQVLLGRFPDDPTERMQHANAARRFELFLLGRELAFTQESFRTYLLDMHRAKRLDQQARSAEQQRLRLYYHTFAKEAAQDSPESEEQPAPAEPEPEKPARPVTPFEDLPGEDEIICPACGKAQPESDECMGCGIVFEKWYARHPHSRPGAMLGELGRQAQTSVGSWRRPEKSGSGLWMLFLYVFAPVALLILFAVFDRMNDGHREELVHLEKELTFLKTQIEEIDTPPQERFDCYLPGRDSHGKRAPAPFLLQVPAHLALSPDQKTVIDVGIQPRRYWYSGYEVEQVSANLQRTWIDESVGSSGMQEREVLWTNEVLINRDIDPRGKERPDFLQDGTQEAIKRIPVDIDRVARKPGDYHLELSIVGWYPAPLPGMLSAYRWRRRAMTCEPATVTLKGFAEVTDRRAVLNTERSALETSLSKLRTRERLSSIARYGLIFAMVMLGTLIFYQAFFAKREE